MTIPPNVRHSLYFAVVAAGAIFAGLEPWEPAWKWLGVAVSLAATLGNALTLTSGQAAELHALRAYRRAVEIDAKGAI